MFLNPAQLNPDSLSAVADLSAQGVYLTVADGKLVVVGIATGSWAVVPRQATAQRRSHHRGSTISRCRTE